MKDNAPVGSDSGGGVLLEELVNAFSSRLPNAAQLAAPIATFISNGSSKSSGVTCIKYGYAEGRPVRVLYVEPLLLTDQANGKLGGGSGAGLAGAGS